MSTIEHLSGLGYNVPAGAALAAAGAPLPDNEAARLRALASYRLLDTAAERAYDSVTALAASICETPIALISLVDRDRQWLKSARGLPRFRVTPRKLAFCAHAILARGLMEVHDAAIDPRFFANPLVTEYPRIRFYAAVPLVDTEGHALGALCVIDQRPKYLLAGQRTALKQLAEVVMGLFEARKASALRPGRDGSGAAESAPTAAQPAAVDAAHNSSYRRAGNAGSPQEQNDRKHNAAESRQRPRRAAA